MSDAAGTGQPNNDAGGQQQNTGGNAGGNAPAGASNQPGAAGAGTQQPGDQNPNGSKPNGEGADAGKPGADAVYEYTMPEGVVLDQALADKFTPVAKELGLAPEQANKIASIYAEHVMSQNQQWAEMQVKWADDVRNDPEIGGAKLNESLAFAKAAIELAGGDALKKEIDALGIGNHPALVKAFAIFGRKLAPDSLVEGGRQPNVGDSEQAALATLYPTMVKN